MHTLAIEKRDTKEKARTVRSRGLVPAVFYGPKEDAQAVSINAAAFHKVWQEVGETSIVVLEGVGEKKETLIHAVDFHSVTGEPIHADFYVIERGKKVHVSVPIEFVGEAPAEKDGHIISKGLHEIEIEVRPSELPQHFEVDVSSLKNVGDHIAVGDISLPESAELHTDTDEIIVSVKEYVEVPDRDPEQVSFAETEVAEEDGVESKQSQEEAKEEKSTES